MCLDVLIVFMTSLLWFIYFLSKWERICYQILSVTTLAFFWVFPQLNKCVLAWLRLLNFWGLAFFETSTLIYPPRLHFYLIWLKFVFLEGFVLWRFLAQSHLYKLISDTISAEVFGIAFWAVKEGSVKLFVHLNSALVAVQRVLWLAFMGKFERHKRGFGTIWTTHVFKFWLHWVVAEFLLNVLCNHLHCDHFTGVQRVVHRLGQGTKVERRHYLIGNSLVGLNLPEERQRTRRVLDFFAGVGYKHRIYFITWVLLQNGCL